MVKCDFPNGLKMYEPKRLGPVTRLRVHFAVLAYERAYSSYLTCESEFEKLEAERKAILAKRSEESAGLSGEWIADLAYIDDRLEELTYPSLWAQAKMNKALAVLDKLLGKERRQDRCASVRS